MSFKAFLKELKAAEDMAGTSATCSKQKSSDLGKSSKKAKGNKNPDLSNITESKSAEDGPGKGASFDDMSQEQHLECMKYHKSEYNAIKGKTHKYIRELEETGKTDSKLKYHAKMYHKHKDAV